METILQHIKSKFSSTPLSLWFFYALVFFLPFGTDKIWLSQKAYYYGYLAFYNTFHLYLTDLLFFGLMLVWMWEIHKDRDPSTTLRTNKSTYVLLFIFWLILAISTILSREIYLSLYGLAKITQYLLLFVYITTPSSSPPNLGGEKVGVLSREISRVFWLILATFSLQSIIAISQYLTQSSLGLRILGEEWFRPGLKGVAEFVSREITNPVFFNFFPNLSQNSDILIRGYGTLPHPNVLSGLLFVGVMVNLYMLYEYGKMNPTNTYKLSICLILLLTGLVVTFSRITWAVTVLAVLAWLIIMFVKVRTPPSSPPNLGGEREGYNPKALAVVILTLAAAIIINLFIFGPSIKARVFNKGGAESFVMQESVTNRNLYNENAWRMIARYPLLGVGPRNFVARMDEFASERLLPYMHQPAHNIYLLIAAESGIAALILFLVVIYNIVRPSFAKASEGAARNPVLNYTLLVIVLGLLAVGFFDHYLWTTQQGSMTFWTILGLLAANKKWTRGDLNP